MTDYRDEGKEVTTQRRIRQGNKVWDSGITNVSWVGWTSTEEGDGGRSEDRSEEVEN